jgi:hypothetical protein
MNKLVVHHTYAHGMTFDVSNNLNHGIATALAAGSGLWANSFYYGAGSSRMQVNPSANLNDLGAIRVVVRFYHSPSAGGARRHNLIEGDRSFALFINPDRSLQGTIYDATATWRGATSGPGLVAPNLWHQVEFVHDGIAQCQIYLNGALVAAAYDVRGPVRSISPDGLAIGHWPPDDPRYTFQGYIGEVHLYKYDPKEEVKQLLNPCCIDRKELDKVVERLRAEGWTGKKLGAQARELLHLAVEISAAVRKGDLAQTDEQKRNGAEAMAAFLRRDAAGLRSAFGRMMIQARQNLTQAEIADFGKRLMSQIDQLPLKPEEFIDLARALCWEHAIIRDPQDLVPKDRKRDRPRRDRR